MAEPFPTPFATLLADDPVMTASLQTAVDKALVEFPSLEQPFRTAISLVAVDETTSPIGFQHGGVAFGRTFYSASLLKVAAMYAAFQLRKQVNDFSAEQSPGTAADLFNGVKAGFDDTIADAVPQVNSTPGITRDMKVPKYSQIFTATDTGAGLVADFTNTFRTNMRRMIVNSDNAAAAECVKALGYSWINGTLKAGGFFFPPAQDGIWLGGTFTGAFPPVRIPCVNDIDTAQGASTFDVANMYAHVLNGTLVDAASSTDFSAHLQVTASAGADPSFMDKTRRPQLPFRNFSVTHTKIGSGPLKDGRTVLSEGTVVEHMGSDRKFIAVWQNTFKDDDSVFAMGFIVERAIELFLAGP
jgi:hypothetical protein